MKLVLDTWRGVAINDGTNYVADFPEGVPLVNPTTPITIDMLDIPSMTVGRRHVGPTLSIFIQPQQDYRTKREQLKTLFRTEERFFFYTLTAHDEDDDDRPWSIQAAVLSVAPKDDAFIVLLAPKTYYWRSANVGELKNFTASGQEIDYTIPIVSNHSVYPTLTLEPVSQKSGGYLYERWIMIRNFSNSSGKVDYDFGEDGTGNLNTQALVTAGKMRADGFDVRLLINNVETPRWFSGFNTTATKIWANFQMPNTYGMLLNANFGTGFLSEIQFKNTPTNIERFRSWPAAGTFTIGTEGFTYTSKDATNLKVRGITRGYRGTTIAAHTTAQGANLQLVDVKLVYGNPLADDPEYADDTKPLLDLDASTNVMHVYEFFGDSTGLRTPQSVYSKALGESPESHQYTGNYDTETDPYEVMGFKATSYDSSGTWRADTVALRWDVVPPYKVDTIVVSGENYRNVDVVPLANIYYRNPAGALVNIHTIPTPVALDTWEPWTWTSSSLSALPVNSFRFNLLGSVAGVEGSLVMHEVQELTINYVPSVVPITDYGPENGTYDYNTLIENLTTGHSITVKRRVRLTGPGATGLIVIDSENHVVTVNGNKSSVGIVPSNSKEWFRMDPGINVIRVTDAGMVSVDLEIVGPATRGV
jgi:hypothetical protein